MPAAIVAVGATVAGAAAASAATAGFFGAAIAGSAFASSIIGGVVSFGVQALGSSLLGGEQDSTGGQEQLRRGILINTESTVAPIPVVYGRRRVGGPRVFGPHLSGDSNQFMSQVFVWSEGPIAGIDQVYLDDRAVSDAFWVSQAPAFAGQSVVIYAWPMLGTDTQPALNLIMAQAPGLWTANHRLRGVAYTFLLLGFEPDKFSGVPVTTADVRGRTVFDPRNGLVAFSDNPALVLRDYLTNTRYGRGIPESAIDDVSFIDAANYCDALIEFRSVTGNTVQAKRYTCNGVVDTERTPLENTRDLLTSCRGMLVFTGGKYRLRIDRPEAVSFAFTEDNIVGPWQIDLGGKRGRVNRVRARFFHAGRRFAPDITVVESAAMRAEDNGLLLEREIALPFTTAPGRAGHLAQMELKQSRQSIVVTCTATLEALQVEVGDVVSITHTRPGWDAKPFRVLRMLLRDDDLVEITAIEYDPSVYVLDDVDSDEVEADTNLPSAFAPAPPGKPVVSEDEFIASPSAGVRARVTLTWAESPDPFLDVYEVEHRLSGGDWLPAGTSRSPRRELLDLAPGNHEFRVRARNTLGVSSDWATTAAEVLGLFSPPGDVQGLDLSTVGGLAILRWTQTEDLDVLIGGVVEFRHSPLMSGAAWSASSSIGAPVGGGGTLAILPLKPGTYLVKFRDASGVRSTTAAAVATSAGAALAFSSVATVTESPTFPGSHDDTVAVDGVLKLASIGDVDSVADWDAVPNVDALGGIAGAGTYTFSAGIDLGVVKPVRLRSVISASTVQVTDLVDSRAELIDTWEDFDGDAAGAVVDAQVWERHTDDDPAGTPTWTAWARVDAAEYETRGFEFQCRLSTADGVYNVHVDELSVHADEVI